MFTDIVWRFLILETFVMGALSEETCPFKHPQTWFCTSEFVVKVKFDELVQLKKGHGYKMEIIKVLKGNLKDLKLKYNRYVDLEATNKLNFMDGSNYLIFGRNKNGKIYSHMCMDDIHSFSQEKHYGQHFRKFYKTGCDCIDKIGKYSSDKLCHWYSSFMKKFGQHCKWVKTCALQLCQKMIVKIIIHASLGLLEFMRKCGVRLNHARPSIAYSFYPGRNNGFKHFNAESRINYEKKWSDTIILYDDTQHLASKLLNMITLELRIENNFNFH